MHIGILCVRRLRINENFLRDSERVKDFFAEQVEDGLLFVIDLTNDILVRLFISTFEQSTSLLEQLCSFLPELLFDMEA